jgi:hypothetical protein
MNIPGERWSLLHIFIPIGVSLMALIPWKSTSTIMRKQTVMEINVNKINLPKIVKNIKVKDICN